MSPTASSAHHHRAAPRSNSARPVARASEVSLSMASPLSAAERHAPATGLHRSRCPRPAGQDTRNHLALWWARRRTLVLATGPTCSPGQIWSNNPNERLNREIRHRHRGGDRPDHPGAQRLTQPAQITRCHRPRYTTSADLTVARARQRAAGLPCRQDRQRHLCGLAYGGLAYGGLAYGGLAYVGVVVSLPGPASGEVGGLS